ncbi:alkaline phosphatase family protein [Pontibacter ramchanderi]|uniref:Phosphopentomutase/2, 3-bisphosphoglycerate-independent phosphoglycerate mutase family metalloenzyme n=1 Tax=Pontibacter ramchanderi TaxID=1179743 RepID=A0A2N3V452_9BACT|nr:alkaline phosphatase family protein [Pontibacter ramchanderi]PKV76400.1 phosphopentomutase/2,3-bisphosphoglycerate-independent phosphoglycerate mutase family metalloenzyme [Pontibacter ramchanderi]
MGKAYLKRWMKGWQQAMLALAVAALLNSCAATGAGGGAGGLRSENVIILVIDGVRYSETWGAVPGLIPNMSQNLLPQGTFCNNFRNEGYTYTNSGHTAITTGINQPIDNYGTELPANPSFFQVWLRQTGKPATAAWIVSSKDKLDILGNTLHPDWQGQALPSLNCGVSGPGSGYRADSLTLVEVLKVLQTHRPNLMLINLMEPDGYAHAGNWENYLRGIARGDRYARQLWDFLQKNSHYRKKTTLLITTDHGRHLDTVDGGWVDHGDDCEGCRRISLLALGPDFKRGGFLETKYTLVDISATVAPMMGISFLQSEGVLMKELFTRRSLRRLPTGTVPVP